MAGLLVLVVVVAWLLLSIRLAMLVAAKVRAGLARALVACTAFASLFVAPVADELAGGFQFRTLCSKASFQLGVPDPAGRTTRVTIKPSNQYLSDTAIPIRHSHIEYNDVGTGDLVVAFDRYVAEGGLLIRTLGFSNSNSPLTLGSPSCSPENATGKNVRLTLGFRVIN